VTAALVPLAHDLGLDVVAVGVSDDTQVAQLCGLGCDLAQGSYFSPAVDADSVSVLLASPSLP
jgi:EAL domain-containing protein (putative c-di-GMP-specific phosphodiesterase class I)